MDFLYSGAFARVVSTGALALYQHLGPAHHHLLRPVFGLCWNALGLSNQLLARRHHSYLRAYLGEIRNARCRRVARSPGSPITFEVWTGQGTWFWYVANPQRNCGAIGAAATKPEAIREARSSIKEMSACAGHVLPPRSSLAMPPRSKNPI